MAPQRERTIILIKAWPQPSQKYGETVCCAGVTPDGEWRRLFPIRFRHLTGEAQFSRWDIVSYRPDRPRDDRRVESRRVHEDSLQKEKPIPVRERAGFFDKLFRSSTSQAAERGESLTLIRPRNVKFIARRRSASDMAEEEARRVKTAAQGNLFDKELLQIAPCPYELKLRYEDADGRHEMACGDWETAAAFFSLSRQYGDERALEHLRKTYEEAYVTAGIALALGTAKKRPEQWMLLGILRLDEAAQPSLL
ncbi:hypothetical protein P7B02_11480 [Caulobacter segnis]|uniref:hypothetical protein n=1 Tax=Caulobacter segnis TaxID=88688 RepID=UPI002410063D|nr:hypothetical protein [Caulobacter segnis]MDG2522162.1 hypothetical protein [Caulobacter segnis]